jgi:hypothetical protein
MNSTLPVSILWAWSRLAERLPGHRLLPPIALFLILYGIGGLVATWAGNTARFYEDVRWLMPLGTITLASMVLAYVPVRLDRVLDSVQPWSRTTAEEFQAFRETAPVTLTKAFWITGPFWALALLPFAIIDQADPNQWNQGYPDPWRYWSLMIVPVAGYFIGGATAILLVGIALLSRRMDRELTLDERFILEVGVGPLRPINRLIWLGWGWFALPAMLLAAVAFTVGNEGEELGLVNFIPLAMLFLIFLVALSLPHVFLNRLLGAAKGRIVGQLRKAINEAAAPADGADTAQLLRNMQRHQHLRYELDRVLGTAPTLFSLRYGVQVGLSITGIFLANVALKVAFT